MNPKILYDNKLSDGTLTASHTDADPIYNVAHLTDLRPHTLWKGTTADPLYVDVDLGALTCYPIGSNLITNGGFDSTTTGWTANNATLASAAGGQSGNCLQVTRTGGTDQGAYQFVTLTPGKAYRLTAYVKSGTSGNELYGIYYDGGNLHRTDGTTSGSWVQVVIDFVARISTQSIYLEKLTGTAGTMLFDTVSLYELAYPPMANALGICSHNLEAIKARIEVSARGSDDDYVTVHEGFRKNLLTNGHFNNDATGWLTDNCTATVNAGGQSETCVSLLRTGATGQYIYQDIVLAVGKTYRASFFVKNGSISGTSFYAGVIDSYGLSQGAVGGTTTASWVRITFDFVCYDGTTSFWIGKNNSTAGSILFDSVELYELLGDNAPVFIPFDYDIYSTRYWRIKITGHTAAPYLGVVLLGECLDFPYPPDTPHEPAQVGIEATTEVSKVGNLLGSIVNYKPITINAVFSILSRDFVYNEFKPFWDSHASLLMPFFWGFDLTTYPESAYFVIIDPASKFSTPLSVLAYVDSLTLAMKGVS